MVLSSLSNHWGSQQAQAKTSLASTPSKAFVLLFNAQVSCGFRLAVIYPALFSIRACCCLFHGPFMVTEFWRSTSRRLICEHQDTAVRNTQGHFQNIVSVLLDLQTVHYLRPITFAVLYVHQLQVLLKAYFCLLGPPLLITVFQNRLEFFTRDHLYPDTAEKHFLANNTELVLNS